MDNTHTQGSGRGRKGWQREGMGGHLSPSAAPPPPSWFSGPSPAPSGRALEMPGPGTGTPLPRHALLLGSRLLPPRAQLTAGGSAATGAKGPSQVSGTAAAHDPHDLGPFTLRLDAQALLRCPLHWPPAPVTSSQEALHTQQSRGPQGRATLRGEGHAAIPTPGSPRTVPGCPGGRAAPWSAQPRTALQETDVPRGKVVKGAG